MSSFWPQFTAMPGNGVMHDMREETFSEGPSRNHGVAKSYRKWNYLAAKTEAKVTRL